MDFCEEFLNVLNDICENIDSIISAMELISEGTLTEALSNETRTVLNTANNSIVTVARDLMNKMRLLSSGAVSKDKYLQMKYQVVNAARLVEQAKKTENLMYKDDPEAQKESYSLHKALNSNIDSLNRLIDGFNKAFGKEGFKLERIEQVAETIKDPEKLKASKVYNQEAKDRITQQQQQIQQKLAQKQQTVNEDQYFNY